MFQVRTLQFLPKLNSLNWSFQIATLVISDLRPAGYDLLSDSESFLSNLSEEGLSVQGGNRIIPGPTLNPVCLYYLTRKLF